MTIFPIDCSHFDSKTSNENAGQMAWSDRGFWPSVLYASQKVHCLSLLFPMDDPNLHLKVLHTQTTSSKFLITRTLTASILPCKVPMTPCFCPVRCYTIEIWSQKSLIKVNIDESNVAGAKNFLYKSHPPPLSQPYSAVMFVRVAVALLFTVVVAVRCGPAQSLVRQAELDRIRAAMEDLKSERQGGVWH